MADAPLLELTPEICTALHLTKERKLPIGLIRHWSDGVVRERRLVQIDSDSYANNKCGQYSLAVIGTLLFSLATNLPVIDCVVDVETVFQELRRFAEERRQEAMRDGQRDWVEAYARYLALPTHHILESFEASWYLSQSGLNVVAMTDRNDGSYTSDVVRHDPQNELWVFLLHVDKCHWTNVARKCSPKSFSMFFTTDEARPLLDRGIVLNRAWCIENMSPPETRDLISLGGQPLRSNQEVRMLCDGRSM
jgi:hypothetical protein